MRDILLSSGRLAVEGLRG